MVAIAPAVPAESPGASTSPNAIDVQLALIVLYGVTVTRVLTVRAFGTPEGSLELSAEAVWGMIAFATVPLLASLGAVYAAWQSRRAPATAPWDEIDVAAIGGSVP